jgi:hypothetical protein
MAERQVEWNYGNADHQDQAKWGAPQQFPHHISPFFPHASVRCLREPICCELVSKADQNTSEKTVIGRG